MRESWSQADQRQAELQGWGMFAVEDGTLQIQRLDETERFPSDEATVARINCWAAMGNSFAQRAIRLHGTPVNA